MLICDVYDAVGGQGGLLYPIYESSRLRLTICKGRSLEPRVLQQPARERAASASFRFRLDDHLRPLVGYFEACGLCLEFRRADLVRQNHF